ncbi:MAG TPA: hypothetical protein VIH76_13550, partial [Candidatus Acidoferrales bacterium]
FFRTPTKRRRNFGPTACALIFGGVLFISAAAKSQESAADTTDFLRRAFLKHEFNAKFFGPARWLNGGEAYTTVEASPNAKGARDLVRYDTATGRREVLVSAADVTPSGAKEPLAIDDYDWSPDLKRLLIFSRIRGECGGETRAAITGFSISPQKIFESSAATRQRPH